MTLNKILIIITIMATSQWVWGKPPIDTKLSPFEEAQQKLVQGYQLIKNKQEREGIRVLR